MELNLLQKILLWAIPLIFAITVHEVAHGYVANKLGDPTAKNLGRITLNPIKHIDPVGTIIIPGVLLMLGGIVFGWAKPVPVNWRNLGKIRRDMALVAAAGPFANLLMALLWAVVAKVGQGLYAAEYLRPGFILFSMGSIGIQINFVLLILNLLPIPPLDGSRVVMSFLKGTAAIYYAKIEPFGFIILIGLLVIGLLNYVIMPAVVFSVRTVAMIFNLPIP